MVTRLYYVLCLVLLEDNEQWKVQEWRTQGEGDEGAKQSVGASVHDPEPNGEDRAIAGSRGERWEGWLQRDSVSGLHAQLLH